ncbi:hypothetical protein IVB40_31750 [Bradyrhizobium sp. 40]|uniref:hypothetical protein n=1 Tax=Bradyrhizobium sp. 40 TaxID=2782674 RepID=UPI001FFF4E26|nr:hypothetical protein [Bradyrhizobium sp. 40]UPJ41807.1 hypothetical protein IVB40_31750 [Bradyrhizobium sp. 40]
MTTLLRVLSPTAAVLYDAVNSALSPDQLDNVGRAVWHRVSNGELSDEDATFLSQAIEKRRPGRRPHRVDGVAVSVTAARKLSHFAPRPCRRRLTDEERLKRRHRKRMLGGSSTMPDTLRHHFTEGERAALCIIAGEVKRHGVCDLSIDEIADRAGVGRTTVQNAMHEARRLELLQVRERPQRGAKHLTNVVRVISPAWVSWIKRAPSVACGIGSKSFTKVSTLKNTDIKIEGDGANNAAPVRAGWHVRAMRAQRRETAQHQRQQSLPNRDLDPF